MSFRVGDKVVHRFFGPGEIVGLDEKILMGESKLYYVFEAENMSIWVPVNDGNGSLRETTSARAFGKVRRILRSPGEILNDDRYQRQSQLTERMREGTVESLCMVVRDLNTRAGLKKLNENDSSVLRRATELLENEWQLSQGKAAEDVHHEVELLLIESRQAALQMYKVGMVSG